MLAALPAHHPLAADAGTAAAAAPLPLTALEREPFILYRRPTGPGLYDSILAACRAAGFSPLVAQEAPRLPATLSLVAAGLGVSVVPASMRRLGGEDIVYRDLDCPGLSAPLHLALRRGNRRLRWRGCGAGAGVGDGTSEHSPDAPLSRVAPRGGPVNTLLARVDRARPIFCPWIRKTPRSSCRRRLWLLDHQFCFSVYATSLALNKAVSQAAASVRTDLPAIPCDAGVVEAGR